MPRVRFIRPSSFDAPRAWVGWSLAFGLTLLVLVLVMLPPFLGEGPRYLLMRFFSALCHQIPERSPHLHGVSLAVCHRCLGIYGGLPLAALAFLAVARWDDRISRAARFLIPASLIPPGADWLGGALGLWTNTPATRVLTGAVFGLVAGYFLTRALVELFAPRLRPGPAAGPTA